MSKMFPPDTNCDVIELKQNYKEIFNRKIRNFIEIQETIFNINETDACDRIATRINVDRTAVSNWKNGKKFPSMENLIKLSIIMNCSLDELLTDTNRFTEEDIFSFSKVGITEKQANKIYDTNSVAMWLENYRISLQKLGFSEKLANAMYSQTHKQQPQTLFGPSLPIISYWAPFNYLIENKEYLPTYMSKMNNFADKISICSLDNQNSEKIKKARLDVNNEIYFDKQYEKIKDNVPSNIKKDLEDFEQYSIENSLNVYKKHAVDVFCKTVN